MRIGILKESQNRVALAPAEAKKLVDGGFEVWIENKAGESALFDDAQYVRNRANTATRAKVLKMADLFLQIEPPKPSDVVKMKDCASIAADFGSFENYNGWKEKKLNCFALNLLPRLSNLQNMDILSSQDMLGGYAAAHEALSISKKIPSMMITAAGTLYAANALVVGLGVFGLSAAAALKKAGANVFAFDIAPNSAEIINSVGARFVDLADKGKKNEFFHKVDILICAASGKSEKAPKLIGKDSFVNLPNGCVIIDAAIKNGGNVYCTKAGKTIEVDGITVVGTLDWAEKVANSASALYSKNMYNFVLNAVSGNNFDFGKSFMQKICICRCGNQMEKK